MSKQNNLTDFLTDVADAIREKKGTTEKINPQDFSSEILSIEIGGGDGFNARVEIDNPTVCSPLSFTKVIVDEGVTTVGGFFDSQYLVEIVVPEGVKWFMKSTFQDCFKLSNINFPDSLEEIGMNCFHNCLSLGVIRIGRNVNMINQPFGANMTALTHLSVSEDNPKYDSRGGCNAIIETAKNRLIVGCNITVVPDTVTIIGTYAFRAYTMTKMYLPFSVIRIEDYAFRECNNIQFYDFRDHTTVPALASSTALAGTSTFKIVVPDALYDQWIAATNWSSLASRIVKASEFVEPTNNE